MRAARVRETNLFFFFGLNMGWVRMYVCVWEMGVGGCGGGSGLCMCVYGGGGGLLDK